MYFDRSGTYLCGLHSHTKIIKTKQRHKCLMTAVWLHTSSYTHDCEKLTAFSQFQDSPLLENASIIRINLQTLHTDLFLIVFSARCAFQICR